MKKKIQKIKTTLTSVIERYVAGEEIRIWYSYNPDELCGMYWLMKQLQPLNCQTTIYLVKLPTWEYGKENTMTSKIAWGEVSPGEWGNYITLQEKANPVFLSACAMKWNQLQNENAPLRAMLMVNCKAFQKIYMIVSFFVKLRNSQSNSKWLLS